MTPPAPRVAGRSRSAAVRLAAALGLVAVGAAAACVEGRLPTAVDLLQPVTLAVVPTFPEGHGAGSSAAALAINRIRVTVRPAGSDSVMLVDTTTVDPLADRWEVELQVQIPGATAQLELTIELINVAGDGTETVEWSARQETTVTQGQSSNAPRLPVTRGPIDNLSVDSVVAAVPPRNVLIEGDTVRLTAVTHGGGAGARHYWGTLDPTLAAVGADGLVTTLLPGVARIVAVAGPKADTVSLTVVQAVAGILLEPETTRITQLGGTATIGMTVIDPRGAAVAGSGVEYQLLEGSAVEDLGNRTFRALLDGTQRVAVTGFRLQPVTSSGPQGFPNVADTAVTDTATIIVETPVGAVASVTVSPDFSVVATQGTGQLTGTAKDALGRTVPGATVTWSSTDALIASVTTGGVVSGVARGVVGIVGTVGSFVDTAVVAVADASTLVSTAFVGGQRRADVTAGQQITVAVKLDMSKVGSDGDLGAAQFVLTYDPAVLSFVSAASGLVAGTGVHNGDVAGTVAFAMASTSVQGTPNVTLLAVTFDVGSVAAGTVSQLGLAYVDQQTGATVVPNRTDLTPYAAVPLTVGGRLRVITP